LQVPATSEDELPHITWCATGSLGLLPIHAAGLHFDKEHYTTEKLYHYAVSSYTPTLSALLHVSRSSSNADRGVLAVSQPATPHLSRLPGTVDEVTKIKELMKQRRFHWLNDNEATVANVIKSIEHYGWIHLACHGIQRQDEATQSAFALYDGHLTLEKISRLSLKSAQLAFLSACQTATGAKDLPDEAVHLGAGMLMAGYKSVIATLWSISDLYAPKVAEDVYRELLKETKMKEGRVARALHHAVGRLREDVGENELMSWVPFIHLGQ
jgi:CHAT domain-containing protein